MKNSNRPKPQNLKKKKRNLSPEGQLLFNLTECSRNKDLRGSLSLYETAVSQNLRLSQHHFNALLYLCSNSATDPSLSESAIEYGFRIYNDMISNNVTVNEASITAVARLAGAKGDGDYAFEVVKNMGKSNAPRLRTYGPALFCFCDKLEAEKAYEVEEHMNMVGLSLEEPELVALLKVSAEMGKEERVYRYLHKLRDSVRFVSESSARVIEDWFLGERACKVGNGKWEKEGIKEIIMRNGGGWHGMGWIGSGKWVVKRGTVESGGRCCCCGEQLACVDIDEVETERFALLVAGLAMERETKANFRDFQDWLDKHSDFEAIVDGANVGLYQQNFADGGFSVSQLDAVVRELYSRSRKKWPLVILHIKRLRALLENPSQRNIVEEWLSKGVIYTTPHGSNDDWYWLYAAVKLKCLLVTNDEMRDHIFELLGSRFIQKWKERHQVRYTFMKGSLKLQMPSSYSLVIQESEKGSWHVPINSNSGEELAKSWLCISRQRALEVSSPVLINTEDSEDHQILRNNDNSQTPFLSVCVTRGNGLQDIGDLDENPKNYSAASTGKRKERSPTLPD